MPLCRNCKRFDLQSFRQDLHGRRGLVYDDVLENSLVCSFCNLLRSCFVPRSEATWLHLELLNAQRQRVGRGLAPLQAAYLRVVLAERPYFALSGKLHGLTGVREALLHICADEGMCPW